MLLPDGAGGGKVGEAFETGPLAVDTHLVRLPPRRPDRRACKWQLRMHDGKLAARLGRARRELGPRLEATRVPARAITGKTDDGRAVTPPPGAPINAMPGDAATFDFELPEHPERYELFLSSRGYYLEWMRREWLAEENPARARAPAHSPRARAAVARARLQAPRANHGACMFWEEAAITHQ